MPHSKKINPPGQELLMRPQDAEQTRHMVQEDRAEWLLVRTELASAANCHRAVERVVAKWGRHALEHLASQHASFITGQLLPVNRGQPVST